MRLLLDTHALLWCLVGDRRLSERVIEILETNGHEFLVSAVSAFEITTKHRIGKLPEADFLARDVMTTLQGLGFTPLSVSMSHAERAGRLPGPHRDPFDRLLIAQAIDLDMPVVTDDAAFADYNCRIFW